jgi:DNA-binding HxlR family transcriptional regulator
MNTDLGMLNWRSVCPISSGLDILGDRWSLLIVRDLHSHDSLTYSEFLEAPEHIATNILAARLRLLTFVGIIERTDPRAAARNNAYRLTTSGKALRPVLEELGQWSESYLKTLHTDMVDIFNQASVTQTHLQASSRKTTTRT